MTLNFHARYAHLVGDLLRNGRPVRPRGEATLELEDVVVELDPKSDDGAVRGRTQDRYLLAEMAWYCSRDPSVAFIKNYAKLWGGIANPDGTANSNYGEKLWGGKLWGPGYSCAVGCELPHERDEWAWARRCLQDDPATRQAVMVIHRPESHWVGNRDVPCTLTVSFTIRDGLLKCRAHMRSSDVWFGLPYDVPFFRWLQRRMAGELLVEVGHLRVTLDSLHVYGNRAADAAEFLRRWQPAMPWANPVPFNLPLDATADLCVDLLADLPGGA